MAKKKVRRLCALGESVILVEGEKILKCYNFELEEIVEEIDKVMSKPFRRPADIFKETIENIIGEEYKFTNGRFKIGGMDHVLCDQKIYKLCEEIHLLVCKIKAQPAYSVSDIALGGYQKKNIHSFACGDNVYLCYDRKLVYSVGRNYCTFRDIRKRP